MTCGQLKCVRLLLALIVISQLCDRICFRSQHDGNAIASEPNPPAKLAPPAPPSCPADNVGPAGPAGRHGP